MSDPMGFLLWVKGPAFYFALAVFALGMLARLVEIFILGRKTNYAEAKGGEWGPGFKTVFTRTVADPGTFARAPFNVVVGWIWHIGFIITDQGIVNVQNQTTQSMFFHQLRCDRINRC